MWIYLLILALVLTAVHLHREEWEPMVTCDYYCQRECQDLEASRLIPR